MNDELSRTAATRYRVQGLRQIKLGVECARADPRVDFSQLVTLPVGFHPRLEEEEEDEEEEEGEGEEGQQ